MNLHVMEYLKVFSRSLGLSYLSVYTTKLFVIIILFLIFINTLTRQKGGKIHRNTTAKPTKVHGKTDRRTEGQTDK